MQKLERTTFETSRTAEYFDACELQAQTGSLEDIKKTTEPLKQTVANGLVG